jgi:hypothetical protein
MKTPSSRKHQTASSGMAMSQGSCALAAAITAGRSVMCAISRLPPTANSRLNVRAISSAQPRLSTMASRSPCRSRRPMARPTMASTA